MAIDIAVKIGKIIMKNPVMAASGTFGYGQEYEELAGLDKLGAIVTKSITLKPKEGNPTPRIIETPSGMLNAIGLQNVGVDEFIKEKMPYLRKANVPVIVSIAGEKISDYKKLAEILSDVKGISGIEINISCPNVQKGGMEFGKDQKATYDVVRAVKDSTKQTIIAKLSPNVTDITFIAQAAEDAGSDALALVNTFLAMSVDIKNRKPKLANITGGLSGPAIKPIVLRMVWEAHKKVKIPIIGTGGIMDADDALEYLICGATAVSVGTANFVNPRACMEIADGIKRYLKENNLNSIKGIIGSIRT